MKYIVYLTKNLKSFVDGHNRIYIGVHKTENPNIKDNYYGCGCKKGQPSTYMYPKTPFQYAFKKYGADAFERTTLFVYDDENSAYNKEAEIVDIDFLKLSYTYNACLGGKHYCKFKKLYQFDTKGVLKHVWEYSKEAYEFYGYPMEQFEYAIHHKHLFLDSYWATKESIDVTEYNNHKHGCPKLTHLYDKKGKWLGEFESRKKCAEYINVSTNSVDKAIYTNSLIAEKYYVSDKLYDLYTPKPRRQNITKQFYVYNKNSELIGKGIGKEIMSIINCHSWSKIHDCFRYHQGWFNDLYISEKEISTVPEKISGNKKKVDIFDKYGNFIETLTSIKEVKSKYKVPASKIKNLEMGDRYFDNYIFKFHKCK